MTIDKSVLSFNACKIQRNSSMQNFIFYILWNYLKEKAVEELLHLIYFAEVLYRSVFKLCVCVCVIYIYIYICSDKTRRELNIKLKDFLKIARSALIFAKLSYLWAGMHIGKLSFKFAQEK